jgi:four helix bundle protein
MAGILRFEEIHAWQTARELAHLVYRVTRVSPFRNDYGLRDQLRRAAVSIMSNIAEGFESRTTPLFIDFLARAKGSAGEVRSHLYVAFDCGYISSEELDAANELADKVSRQISRFMSYLKESGR